MLPCRRTNHKERSLDIFARQDQSVSAWERKGLAAAGCGYFSIRVLITDPILPDYTGKHGHRPRLPEAS